VWLIHPELGGVHYVPDNPGVIESFKGRGWDVTDLPADLDSDDPEFIELLEKLQAGEKETGKAKSATKTKKEVE
jgi:hypothetical protein